MLIRELKNELEDPWCCIESLAPITSVGTAIVLLLFNFFIPGLGTLISGLVTKVPVNDKDKKKDEEDDAIEGL